MGILSDQNFTEAQDIRATSERPQRLDHQKVELIRVRALVTGDRDTSPYFQVFEYSDESYERIFVPSVNMIKEKAAIGLRINFNECLALFCNYVISQLRSQYPIERIEGGARKFCYPRT